MKTCPYCAEDIKDAAIRCRYCLVWLVDDHPSDAEGDRVPSSLAGRVGGMGATSDVPQATVAAPMTTEPMPATTSSAGATSTPSVTSTPAVTSTPSGAASESASPSATDSPSASSSPSTTATPGTSTAGGGSPTPAAETKIEFTHTGSRYLLGYGADYFGIWDRNAPQQPIERFPRTDQGWAAAWQRYSAIETNWMDLRTGQKSG